MNYKDEGESPREGESLRGLSVCEHESLREMSFVRVRGLRGCDEASGL